MNKRIRKKKHKAFIEEVKIEISDSSEWRRRLDLAGPGIDIPITKNDLVALIPWRSEFIEKNNFEFVVHKELLDATIAEFSAFRFPTITDWSYNNLNIL